MQDLAEFKAEMVEDRVRLDRQIQAADRTQGFVDDMSRLGFKVVTGFDDARDTIEVSVLLAGDTACGDDPASSAEPILIEPVVDGRPAAAGVTVTLHSQAAGLPVVEVVTQALPAAEASAKPAETVLAPVDAPMPTPALGSPWSEEEDARAVELFIAQDINLSFGARGKVVAEALGRKPAATEQRLRTKLAPAVVAARKALALAHPNDAAPAPVLGQGKVELGRIGGGGSAADASPASDAVQHVLKIDRRGKYTLVDDLELMESVGDGLVVDVIADQLGITASDVHKRRDLLTGVYKDGNGKLCRTWSNEQVLKALRSATQGVPA